MKGELHHLDEYGARAPLGRSDGEGYDGGEEQEDSVFHAWIGEGRASRALPCPGSWLIVVERRQERVELTEYAARVRVPDPQVQRDERGVPEIERGSRFCIRFSALVFGRRLDKRSVHIVAGRSKGSVLRARERWRSGALGIDPFNRGQLPGVALPDIHQDWRLCDVKTLDLGVEEVIPHVGDHGRDDCVTVRLGAFQVHGIFRRGKTCPRDLRHHLRRYGLCRGCRQKARRYDQHQRRCEVGQCAHVPHLSITSDLEYASGWTSRTSVIVSQGISASRAAASMSASDTPAEPSFEHVPRHAFLLYAEFHFGCSIAFEG